jgi:tRNA (adenine57-N1/adenine58-N1)-methyltransferase
MSAPFESGERVLLIDLRGRQYLVRLQTGGTFHSHSGMLPHDDVLGQSEGTRVETTGGMALTAFRPRFADYVLKMPRGAQVVYPKDLGPILIYADIYPGARVLEAGTGERFDRCVLDVPEPWGTFPALQEVLEPGAVLGCFLPTTIQVHELVLALPGHGFLHMETFEVLRRGWHVSERSVRPDHRMIGHTGFVTVARRTV